MLKIHACHMIRIILAVHGNVIVDQERISSQLARESPIVLGQNPFGLEFLGQISWFMPVIF